MFYEHYGNGLSRVAGFCASLHLPSFCSEFLLGQFAKQFNINLEEAEYPLSHYKSFDEFFTRSLKPDCRPIDQSDKHLISPVDGKVLEFGDITDHTLLQAKGLSYALDDLIPTTSADYFKQGKFLTIYLAPSDCHRIFSPIKGEVVEAIHIPGKLFPVREPYISSKRNLYTVNERLVTILDTEIGKVALVMVGATNVGYISARYDLNLQTNCKQHKEVGEFQYPNPVTMNAGDWINTFHLGSTVILLTESNNLNWTVSSHTHLNYGRLISN